MDGTTVVLPIGKQSLEMSIFLIAIFAKLDVTSKNWI